MHIPPLRCGKKASDSRHPHQGSHQKGRTKLGLAKAAARGSTSNIERLTPNVHCNQLFANQTPQFGVRSLALETVKKVGEMSTEGTKGAGQSHQNTGKHFNAQRPRAESEREALLALEVGRWALDVGR